MAEFSQANRRAALQKVRGAVRLTQIGMLAQRLVLALWPLFSVVLIILAVLMLGLQDVVALEAIWLGALVAIAGLVAGLIYALRHFRLPRRAEALERLDMSLKGRPIRTLLDEQIIGSGDVASAAVWQAHQSRMAAQVETAQPVLSEIRTAPRDPYALRFVAILFFAVALLFGSIWRVGSVTEMAGLGATGLAQGPVWEGWIEPPRYTSRPTLYLNDLKSGPLDVPLGSLITVRLYGEVGALTLAETVSARSDNIPPASATAHEFIVNQSGDVEIAGPGGRIWNIAVLPDAKPFVTRGEDVSASALGEMTLPYRADDDYGVEAGEVRFTLDLASVDRRYGLAVDPEPRPTLVAPLPIPLSGDRKSISEAVVEDFSQHPWANLPVNMQLVVLDAPEQVGMSEPHQMVLPGRRFFDPMAAALIEMRRDILWNRGSLAGAAQILRAASHRPDDVFRKQVTALKVQKLISRMETLAGFNLSDEMQDALAEDIWGLALTIEEGDLADALERLERARERLQEAMRNGASDEEIAELMRELRQATEDYMQQLSRQAQLDADENDENAQNQPDPNAMQMTQDDLQRMMDRIQELMEQGRMAEAEQALRELQELLENMQVTQGQQGQGQSPGEQAMEGLSETLREQQGLSDQAFRDLQEQFNPNAQAGENQGNEGRNGGQGQGQSHENGGNGDGQSQGEGQAQGEQGQGSEQGGEGALADQQRALRQELERQQGQLPGAGTPEGDAAREALDRAGRAMDRAEQDLRDDDYAGAIDNQSQAMDALREGMRNLGDAMAQNQQQGQPGQGQGQGDQQSASRDPLGRDRGSDGGAIDSDGRSRLGQDADVYRRAQDLFDEIRRRSTQTERPEQERDYLKRLLERF